MRKVTKALWATTLFREVSNPHSREQNNRADSVKAKTSMSNRGCFLKNFAVVPIHAAGFRRKLVSIFQRCFVMTVTLPRLPAQPECGLESSPKEDRKGKPQGKSGVSIYILPRSVQSISRGKGQSSRPSQKQNINDYGSLFLLCSLQLFILQAYMGRNLHSLSKMLWRCLGTKTTDQPNQQRWVPLLVGKLQTKANTLNSR